MEIRSVEAIVRALNDARVKYLVVGGLAVVAHGYERLTKDVDLVIGLKRQNIINGLRALMKIGYRTSIPVTPEDFAVARNRENWRKNKNMIVLRLWSEVHRRTPVDVFVYEPFDFKVEYAAAKREEVMPAVKAPVIALKTLLAMKRAAGRPQDLADIADLERINELKKEFPND
jgi:predicted nucleotidyltransferase